MAHTDPELFLRVVVGFALAYLFGFERQVRGSQAGDRTFSMIGASAAAITAVASPSSPQAIAGIVTGIGFIGAGVVFQGRQGLIKGITTAASIFAVAAIGIVVGYGHLLLGTVTAGLLLLTLEIQHIPFLRWLDARNYSDRFENDRLLSGEADEPPSSDEGT